MDVDRDVLLVQAGELERRGHEVLLLVLVEVNPTVSSQHVEGKICRHKCERWRDLPWAENARNGALRLDWPALGPTSEGVVEEAIEVGEESVIGEEVNQRHFVEERCTSAKRDDRRRFG